MQGRQVTFRYKDRSDDNKEKLMTLDVVDFIYRFLLHVMPKGFMRIRHFGFLANAVRKQSLAKCRQYLCPEKEADDCAVEKDDETWQQLFERLTGIDVTLCPVCKTGHLILKEAIPKIQSRWSHAGRAISS